LGRVDKPAIRDWRVLAQSIGNAIAKEIATTGSSNRLSVFVLCHSHFVKLSFCEILQGASYGIYGHSFGALLAYLTTIHIRSIGAPLPLVLMVGSKKPPTQFQVSTFSCLFYLLFCIVVLIYLFFKAS
jgi:hypothetical protein